MSASERESIQKIKMIVSSEHEYLEKVSNRLAPTWLGFFMEVAFALGFTPSLFPFPSFFFFPFEFFFMHSQPVPGCFLFPSAACLEPKPRIVA